MRRTVSILILLCLTLGLCGCGQSRLTAPPFTGEAAAKLSVYAFDPENEKSYGLMYLGHAFLAFENVSGGDLTVGGLTLAPGETCTLGSWSMTAHFGIWYNVESAYIDRAGKYAGRVSLTKHVTAADLAAINDIVAGRDKWSLFSNCSQLALDIFNAADGASISLKGLITPTRLSDAILRYDTAEIDRPVGRYGKIGFVGKGGFEEYAYQE